MIIITNRSRDIRIKIFIKVKNIGTVIIIYFAIKIRPCQTDFLLGVTRAHAKKKNRRIETFYPKISPRSFLFIISEKKNTFHLFQF